MIDIALYDNGQGGDFILDSKDLETMPSELVEIYTSLFGGTNFWGNDILGVKFESITEVVINTTPFTSQGRLRIIDAMKKDLERLNPEYLDVKFEGNKVTLIINNFEISVNEKNTIDTRII